MSVLIQTLVKHVVSCVKSPQKMSLNHNKRQKKMENKDANCRLRHGLNVQCLAHIFRYINIPDLYTVGEMNEFYKQIILDLVISEQEVNFDSDLQNPGITKKLLKIYGTKIQTISVTDSMIEDNIKQFVQWINKHCSSNQLRNVKIDCKNNIDLLDRLQNVKRFEFCGNGETQLSVQLSETVHHICLEFIQLDLNFDWTKLKNLTKLYLLFVRGINIQNFIEFLRHRPNIEVFHHNRYTFGNSIHDVCKAMAKYCGNQIQEYSGGFCSLPEGGNAEAPAHKLYYFLVEFKNMKRLQMSTDLPCGANLIDAMKQLAENDTIEMLSLYYYWRPRSPNVNCSFQNGSIRNGFDMKPFSHLKTLRIYGRSVEDNDFDHVQMCGQFKLLNVYGSQILLNVENLSIQYRALDWDFIKFAGKLRFLNFFIRDSISSDEAAAILSALESILQQRKNEQTVGDSIEIKIQLPSVFKVFREINGRSDSIQLSKVDFTRQKYTIL